MTDIVERLRAVDHMSVEDCFLQSPLFLHAANEIERLRLAISETEDNTLLSYLADIRQKSGVGIKPMLSELADAIATALSEARATGRREGMEAIIAIAEDYANDAMPGSGYRLACVDIAAAIRAAMEKAE